MTTDEGPYLCAKCNDEIKREHWTVVRDTGKAVYWHNWCLSEEVKKHIASNLIRPNWRLIPLF